MNENVRPRFEAHKLEGTGIRRVATPKVNADGKLLGGFNYEDQEVDAGWMVYFPNGSSTHIWTKEEMERQGFLSIPTLVDMETGDGKGPTSLDSLKSRSEQKERVTRASKVHHTS